MASYVYILASRKNGTLYIGVTNDLVRRAYEHRQGATEGFTRQYAVKRLVYFETYDDVRIALQREKTLKHWLRAWKVALIEKTNPEWRTYILPSSIKPQDWVLGSSPRTTRDCTAVTPAPSWPDLIGPSSFF
jgi:putative endonuclease